MIIVCHNNTAVTGSDAAVESCSLSLHICFNFTSFLNNCCLSKLLPGYADSTFAIQKHIEPKKCVNCVLFHLCFFTRSIYCCIQQVVLLLIRVSDELKANAGEVWHWLRFIYLTATWQVSTAGLEVIFNPKGQTLLVNLGIWKSL